MKSLEFEKQLSIKRRRGSNWSRRVLSKNTRTL